MDVLKDDDRSILFSSHNTLDVEQISDQITFIDRGRIVDSNDKEVFLDRWRRLSLDVAEHVRLHEPPGVTEIARTGNTAEERAHKLLKKVRLEGKENSFPGELSGGQQQRVAIARSLAMNPDVMLFDEVTAALDPETVKEVLVTIRELAEEGMTCLLVTHEMGFAREIADHIYFTDRGVIVEHGPPRTFFKDATDPRTREFLSQIL
jgi:ABC-type polar amino acid transport system ATPase subunit